MKMCDFILHEPDTIEGVCELLARYGDQARIIAGGTDLLVDMKQTNKEISQLISIARLDELTDIKIHNGELWLGALVTLNMIADSPVVARYLEALSEAAKSMASNQIRNIGTIGGNICNAVPSADLPPTLIAANAEILSKSKLGERRIPLKEIFLGPRETVLRDNEILLWIIIPGPQDHTGISYKNFKRRDANALAVAGVASRITLSDSDDLIHDAIIVLGAVAPTPLVAIEASVLLKGKVPDEALFSYAAKHAAEESRPITDIRGSMGYRKDLVEVLTLRSLKEAHIRAKEGI